MVGRLVTTATSHSTVYRTIRCVTQTDHYPIRREQNITRNGWFSKEETQVAVHFASLFHIFSLFNSLGYSFLSFYLASLHLPVDSKLKRNEKKRERKTNIWFVLRQIMATAGEAINSQLISDKRVGIDSMSIDIGLTALSIASQSKATSALGRSPDVRLPIGPNCSYNRQFPSIKKMTTKTT